MLTMTAKVDSSASLYVYLLLFLGYVLSQAQCALIEERVL